MKQYEIACRGDSNVLLTGPTGSGKSYHARRIHEAGPRRNGPFVTVNLACLHEGTIESELFGHERGAFTGALNRRIGRLESAQNGTVFLDEVGELPLRLQARLLEFLQSRCISPVGGNRETRLNVRVIAATNRELPCSVANGDFREDLYHRLRVVEVEMKSLRERQDEFDTILHNTLAETCHTANRAVLGISEGVAHAFESYAWPGNIRELRNVLEYAVASCEDQRIELQDIPQWLLNPRDNPGGSAPAILGVAELPLSLDFAESVGRFERVFLARALERFGGRINHTARAIGLNKTTFKRRLKLYGIGDLTQRA
ncbi:MAG: sigma 54-interacting transcriptional regulator [Bdellovibrionota bacterium]